MHGVNVAALSLSVRPQLVVWSKRGTPWPQHEAGPAAARVGEARGGLLGGGGGAAHRSRGHRGREAEATAEEEQGERRWARSRRVSVGTVSGRGVTWEE